MSLIQDKKMWQNSSQYKITGKKKYNKIPLISVLQDKSPFEVIHVDCCSPWTVNYKHSATDESIKHQILLLIMVNVATGWPEFSPLFNQTSEAAVKCLDKY